MIPKNDLKPGNWISLKLSGSLLEFHKIIETSIVEMDDDGVLIESGEAYTLIKVGNKWEYPKLPLKQFRSLEELKAIPLTTDILDRCGFTLNTQGSTKCYSDKHGFMLNYTPELPNKFIHQGSNVIIEFVHQFQNMYSKYMNCEIEISIDPYNFQMSSYRQ